MSALARSAALVLALLPTAATAAAPEIAVLDRGAQPRAVLQVHPTEGAIEKVRMSMDMETSMELPMMGSQTVRAPTSLIDMEIEVLDVEDDGDIHYRFTIKDVSIAEREGAMPGMGDAMLQALRPMIGTTGDVRVDDSGWTQDARLTPSEAADPALIDNMQRSMRNASAPLPGEAVGVGARWTLTQQIEEQGLTVQQVATYELVEMNGPALVLKTTIQQSAPPQVMQPAGMPEGTSASLSRLVSTGGGTSRLDLGGIMPTQATVDMHLEMDMTIAAQGQEMAMSTRMDMTNLIERR